MITRYLTAVETAKLIRAALKEAFPGVKFSVRTDVTTIDVRWTNGPVGSAVDAVVNPFRAREFGVDYLFAQRGLTPEFRARLLTIAEQVLGEPVDETKWYDQIRGQYVTEWGTWRSATGYNLLRWLEEHVPATES